MGDLAQQPDGATPLPERLTEFFRFFWYEWVRSAAWRQLSSEVTGLPPSAGLILRQLDIAGGMSVAEIGRSLGLDSSTVSRQVQPLRQRGFTINRPRHTNKRVTEISLSGAGRAAAKRLERLQVADFVAVVDRLTPERQAVMGEVLCELQSAMASVLESNSK
jgi:DNA-binding MarR family transcriptional regulator